MVEITSAGLPDTNINEWSQDGLLRTNAEIREVVANKVGSGEYFPRLPVPNSSVAGLPCRQPIF